jgi:hypothetical protein
MAVAAMGGCGHRGGTAEPVAAGDAAPPVEAAPPAPGRFLSPAELDTQLGNGFRQGLYRLAVMSQPGDDAADMGQQLPTGSVRAVSCDPAGPRPSGAAAKWKWSCGVRWATVDGAGKSTRYAVDMTTRGCFYAAATPHLPEHYDSTIRTYSEHPLNSLQSLRSGC